jgi:hypothetical protein
MSVRRIAVSAFMVVGMLGMVGCETSNEPKGPEGVIPADAPRNPDQAKNIGKDAPAPGSSAGHPAPPPAPK